VVVSQDQKELEEKERGVLKEECGGFGVCRGDSKEKSSSIISIKVKEGMQQTKAEEKGKERGGVAQVSNSGRVHGRQKKNRKKQTREQWTARRYPISPVGVKRRGLTRG